MGINLLQDREIIEENARKKKSSQKFDLTNPAAQKDETKRKIKKGGLIEFFKNIFKQSPKIKIQSEEEVIKDVPEIKKIPNGVRGSSRPWTNKTKKTSQSAGVARLEESVRIRQQESLGQKASQSIAVLKTIASSPMELKKGPSPAPSKFSSVGVAAGKQAKPQANKMAPGALTTDSDSLLDINLIPEEIRIKLEPKRKLKILILAVVICFGIILLLWGGMIWQQSRIQKNIQKVIVESERAEQEIAAYESVKKTGEQLNSKISQAAAVLDSHVYWTKFLAELENYTLPDVYYQNMAASLNGTVTLSAVTKDLPTLAKQYQIMQNATKFINTVTITAAAIKAEGPVPSHAEGENQEVTFNITLTVDPAVFYQRNIEPSK